MIDSDTEQKIKEALLQDLIEKMGDQHGDMIKPKGLAVQVAAPDKEHLAEGLDKAKDVIGGMGESPALEGKESPEDEADEERLMKMLEEEDDEDKMKG